MGEICLTYLNSQQVKALVTDPITDTQNTPFLEYCSVYWGVHAKKELSDRGRLLALELLKGDYGEISTRLLLTRVKYFPIWNFDTLSLFNGLHWASFFGIIEVVAGLIEIECCDINEGDFAGRGLLGWAARNGHEGVVKLLLGWGEIIPDRSDYDGRTPLSHAAECGHEGVVKIILGREDVSPNELDNEGRASLSHAAECGHEGVVKILLGRKEVNPDKPDIWGRTPLSSASESGHERMVALLQSRGAVPPRTV